MYIFIVQFLNDLQVYLSILYLRLPQFFNIKLRGRVVEQHNIADDLKFAEFILYRPQTGVKDQVHIKLSIRYPCQLLLWAWCEWSVLTISLFA